MKNIISKIKYYGKDEHTVHHFTTNLDAWLSGKSLEFSPIKGAKFNKGMTLAVREFDKDHCIYILMEEDCFKVDEGHPKSSHVSVSKGGTK